MLKLAFFCLELYTNNKFTVDNEKVDNGVVNTGVNLHHVMRCIKSTNNRLAFRGQIDNDGGNSYFQNKQIRFIFRAFNVLLPPLVK